MPIVNQNSKYEMDRYEKFVSKYVGSSLMQSINWKSCKFNWNSEYIYLEENGKIIAALSILLQKIPKTNYWFAYAPRGPVCDINNIDLVNKLTDEVKLLKDKYKLFLIKFDPNIKYSKDLEDLYKKAGYKVLNKSVGKDRLIQPVHDMVLYLNGEKPEELMPTFGSKTRYNIRLAIKNGVEIYHSRNIKDLKIFYDLYKITTIRDKIGSRPYEYFEALLKTYDKDQMRIYITKHDGQYLSAALAFNYGKELFYLYGASSNEKRNLMPNYLMQWEMIKWGLETNCKRYNLGGVYNLEINDGLYRFKLGFCKKYGPTEYIGEIDKVFDKKFYFIYNKIFPLAKKTKKRIAKLKNKKK